MTSYGKRQAQACLPFVPFLSNSKIKTSKKEGKNHIFATDTNLPISAYTRQTAAYVRSGIFALRGKNKKKIKTKLQCSVSIVTGSNMSVT